MSLLAMTSLQCVAKRSGSETGLHNSCSGIFPEAMLWPDHADFDAAGALGLAVYCHRLLSVAHCRRSRGQVAAPACLKQSLVCSPSWANEDHICMPCQIIQVWVLFSALAITSRLAVPLISSLGWDVRT